MSKELWMMADEEVREEMCDEYGCDDVDLDDKELAKRIEIRYGSKLEDQCERAEHIRNLRNEARYQAGG